MILALFARIAVLAQDKPIATAGAGSAAGGIAWFINWAEMATKFFQLAAGFFGALAAALAVLFLLPRLIRFLRAWRTKGLINADKA